MGRLRLKPQIGELPDSVRAVLGGFMRDTMDVGCTASRLESKEDPS